ncbi:AEC family transporter [Clostridium sp. AM58-1XD]|nr:AEC family transporter [Clostridium sp. AM58-1XD]RGY98441.1 AEC family transporter [Clostridium sp. AM58-1XD]
MQISILLIKQILQLFFMVLMGYAVVKLHLLKDDDSKILSKLVLYLITPCVMINAFQVDFTKEKMNGLLLTFAAGILLQALLLFATWFLRSVFHLNVVEWTSVYYSNSGNLIIPLITYILGEDWVLYASGFLSVQMIMLWTHCKNAFSHEGKIDLKTIFGNINMISIFAGIILFFLKIRLPEVVNGTLHSVGNMIGPICMIVTGMLIGNMDLKAVFSNKRIYFITFLRLVAFPLAAIVILYASHLAALMPDGKTILLVTFLAVITPSASTITQMAQVYGDDAKYASAINVMTTLLCILTMPAIVFLYQLVI